MKKIIIFILFMLCLSGCTNLNEASVDKIIGDVSSSKVKLSNQFRTGFKYYLPTSLSVGKSTKMNEIIINSSEKYYLYVDLISYYYDKDYEYQTNNNAYYSREFTFNDKNGYVEINTKNDKYLIEIIYNYAKIEVIVDKDNINEAVANGLVILSSISYQRDIINNLLGEDVLNYSEEKFSIFESEVSDSNFLEYVQEYDTYKPEIPDYDLIN